jgi:hypothetical protein
MILLMKNQVNEFVPGCDWTAVQVDRPLVEAIAARACLCRQWRKADGSLAELRFWDANPQCIESPDPETAEASEDALNGGDGWAVLDDNALGTFEAAHADCTQMTISLGEESSVSWACRVGSEPIRTVDVPLAELGRKLGSPLGDPLKDIP